MRILIVLLSIPFVACGQQTKKYVIDPKAKFLADSAYKFVRSNPSDTVNLRSAIELLRQATAIDRIIFAEGQAIIKELIQNNHYPAETEGLKLYLNKTGHEIIVMLLNGGETQTVSPNQQ